MGGQETRRDTGAHDSFETFIDKNGNTVFQIGATGALSLAALTAASATAGTSGALPAQASGYLLVTIGGTQRKIPFFNV